MYGYRAQYRRMAGYLSIAQREHGNTPQKEDELITFFMHCWHLKDHIQNDPTLDRAVRKHLCDVAHKAPVLRYAQKIANGTKHYELKYSVAMKGAHDLTVGPLGAAPQAKTYPLVSMPNGRSIRAIDLAEKAVKQWIQFE
jgi:hypothetical protein